MLLEDQSVTLKAAGIVKRTMLIYHTYQPMP
jgi:hypothetical protein